MKDELDLIHFSSAGAAKRHLAAVKETARLLSEMTAMHDVDFIAHVEESARTIRQQWQREAFVPGEDFIARWYARWNGGTAVRRKLKRQYKEQLRQDRARSQWAAISA